MKKIIPILLILVLGIIVVYHLQSKKETEAEPEDLITIEFKTNYTLTVSHKLYIDGEELLEYVKELSKTEYLGKDGETGAPSKVVKVYRPVKPGTVSFYLVEEETGAEKKSIDMIKRDHPVYRKYVIGEDLKITR